MPRRERNFRDVGETINRLSGRAILRAGVLYRSGAIEETSYELPTVSTIINLRRQSDPAIAGVTMLQVAPSGHMNNYLVHEPIFLDWIQRFYSIIAEQVEWPVQVHCESGKDRTGVAVALLLKFVGVDRELIVREYLEGDFGQRYPDSVAMVLKEADRCPALAMSPGQIAALRRRMLGS